MFEPNSNYRRHDLEITGTGLLQIRMNSILDYVAPAHHDISYCRDSPRKDDLVDDFLWLPPQPGGVMKIQGDKIGPCSRLQVSTPSPSGPMTTACGGLKERRGDRPVAALSWPFD